MLGKLDNPHHKWTGTQMMASTSHTETLLQKLQQDQTLKMQRSAPPPVSVRLHQDPETKIKKINVLRNLRVKCKVDNSGATVHATWEALRDVWGLPRDIGLVYEVQMIVRWISSQTWNTIYTVTEPTCTVKGLKPNCPFAVRVRAVMGNWSSDYTIPCEFVTQESQTPEHQPSAVAAHEQNAQTFQSSSLKQAEHKPESESKKIPEISSFYPPQMSYLERVMQARQEQADREAAKAAADKAAAERAAVEKVLAERAASERAVVEQAAREHREQEQQVEMQKEANIAQASRVHVQRAAAPADTRSEGMSDYANLALSMNTNLPSTASNERVTTGSDGKQRVVVRISLSDPKNPHYAKYQEQMAAQKLEKEKEAEQPVQRQIQHTESSELYGSIYQARRATPDVSITTTTVVSSTQATGTVVPSTKAPAELYGSNRDMYGSDRRVVHTTPLIYHSKPMTESTGPSYLDPLVRLGPLARAFGVSSYARGEVPQEVRRVIAKPVSHMTASSDVPMVRAHVVNAGEDLRPADPITLRRRGVA